MEAKANNDNKTNEQTTRRRVRVDASKDGRTHQSMKQECDINQIMERHRVTGMVTHVNNGQPRYGDFSNLGDYQEALYTMKRAEEAFMTLDAHVRRKFSNDPQELIDFLDNPANDQEAIELGLKVAGEQAVNHPGGSQADSQEPAPTEEPAE